MSQRKRQMSIAPNRDTPLYTFTMAHRRRCSWTLLTALVLAPLSLTLSINPSSRSFTKPASSPYDIRFVPALVHLDQVSQQYTVTVMRRLFSSQPVRAKAVNNVTLTASSELLLLTGASDCGKSALLKLVAGSEQPVEGSVTVQSLPQASSSHNAATPPPQPIYLDQRPTADSIRTVGQILRNELAKLCSKGTSSSSSQQAALWQDVSHALTDKLCHCLDLSKILLDSPEWMDQTTTSQLTTSEHYRLQLLIACLQSCMGNMVADAKAEADLVLAAADCSTTQSTTNKGRSSISTISFPAPVLLLDEWMDTETTTVVQAVQHSLVQLVDHGAVVLSATHKADRWKTPYSRIILSRGQLVLSSSN